MNKIYKVIWSKVRNCYVAVSEIAKRNGKSCTSVNCGGKANRTRSLHRAAVTLGVTAALIGCVGFGSPIAWADGIITVRDASAPDVYDNAHTTGGTLNNISSALYYPSDPSINQLIITGGASNNKGFVACETSGAGEPVTGYTVDVRGTGTSINFAFGIRITSDTSGRTATGNSSNITDGASVSGNVYGAYGIGVVSGNAVTIDNAYAYRVYGGYSEEETAKGNIVNISGIKEGKDYTVFDNVYGGYSANGMASGNIVKITDAVVNKNSGYSVYGGSSRSNVANSNNVTVSGNSKTCTVYGGYSDTGAAKGNTVTINKNEKGETPQIEGYIYGGYSKNGTAGGATAEEGNKVTISGGTVDYYVYGGYVNSGTGAATGNKVDISQTSSEVLTKVHSVYGGYSNNGTAGGATAEEGNKVTITGGRIGNRVYGGYVSGTGAATGNKVNISQTGTEVLTIIDDSVYGGYSNNGTAGGATAEEGNKVTINGGTVGSRVYGGYVYGSGSAINNSVDISGDSIVSDVYGSFIKSDGNGEAVGNKVVITGENTTIKGRVYGAAVNYSQDVKNNSVKFEANKGSTAYDVYVYGGVALYSSVGAVEENRVEITGGTASFFSWRG